LGCRFSSKHGVRPLASTYNSEIVIASPLGLTVRREEKYSLDFLSSVELLIMDQADVMLMQNWEHVVTVMNFLNKTPKSLPPEMDISRIRAWTLNGWSKHVRQSIILSSHVSPEINALFKKFENFAGKVRINFQFEGAVSDVKAKIKQTFRRIDCESSEEIDNVRFDFFSNELFPKITGIDPETTLLFVPSYFDYVRVKKFIKRENEEFIFIDEYMSNSRVTRMRGKFVKDNITWLIQTERMHFYKRVNPVHTIKRVIFYAPPQYPEYYSEILNKLKETDATCLVLYTKFDRFELERVVGTARAERMLGSEKNVHMFY